MKHPNYNSFEILLAIVLFLIILNIYAHSSIHLYVALGIGFAGILSSAIRGTVSTIWMKIAWTLGLFIPNILLAIIFFMVLFPIAFLSRIFRKPDLLKLKNRSQTMYVDRHPDHIFKFEEPW